MAIPQAIKNRITTCTPILTAALFKAAENGSNPSICDGWVDGWMDKQMEYYTVLKWKEILTCYDMDKT
jgi:hypothetical protein